MSFQYGFNLFRRWELWAFLRKRDFPSTHLPTHPIYITVCMLCNHHHYHSPKIFLSFCLYFAYIIYNIQYIIIYYFFTSISLFLFALSIQFYLFIFFLYSFFVVVVFNIHKCFLYFLEFWIMYDALQPCLPPLSSLQY